MVEYKYDAWGKVLSITGSKAGTVGQINPFRYRGYLYDNETGLYYLKSRYYNPEWGRFISADVVLGKTGELLGHNLYCYCGNNPIKNHDPAGALCVDAFVERDNTRSKSIYWRIGDAVLYMKGYNIAKACYDHFLWGHGEPLPTDVRGQIGSAVAESEVFQKRILDNAPSQKWIWIDSVPYEKPLRMTGDLLYAIGHINPQSLCIRTPQGIFGISFFSDEYDFRYIEKDENESWFTRLINNEIGYFMQENGMGINYQINVLFPFFITNK